MSDDRMIRQMALVACHHPMQFFAAMKNLGATVAVSIQVSAPDAVGSPDPDIGVAARDEDIAIDCARHVDIGRQRLVGAFDHHGRRCRHRYADPVRAHRELALSAGDASRQHGRAGNRTKQNS